MTELVLDAEILEAFVHQILPEKPLLTSRSAGLNNVFLAHYLHSGCHLDDHNIPLHVLEVISSNYSSYHERRFGDDAFSSQLHGGEIFFCPAGAGHEITWSEKMGFTLLAFHPKLFEEFDCDRADFIPLFNIFDPHLFSLVTAIQKDLAQGCPGGSLYSDSQAVALASHLFFKHIKNARKSTVDRAEGLPNYTLEKVLEYLRFKVDLGEDIVLQDMAAVAGMSQSHFWRLFRQSMGVSADKYHDRLRIERAKSLLLTTDLNVTEVAGACGFKPDYFPRRFKQLVGMSPSAFRKEFKKSILIQ
jgi:AraC family transcriptional regulator